MSDHDPQAPAPSGYHVHFKGGRVYADDKCGHSDRHRSVCLTCHPVIVIDLAVAEQLDRLADVFHVFPHTAEAALREFANPTPAKPEEPQGLGAVVEDGQGQRYVRLGFTHLCWRHETERDAYQPWRHWGQIKAVRVLSEGVSE